jgi:ABC-2 type transport system ATP-binding protein
VLGRNPTDRNEAMLKRITLLMGNKQQLWWDLPAWDGFLVLKEIFEVPPERFKARVERLIEVLQIQDKLHVQVRKLSLGERMKCELVAALLHAPEIVFLDEPTLGLDVVSQKRIRDFLRDLHRDDGCTIILTSHYMQDVSELCKRVIVIDHGALVFDGTLDALSAQFSDKRYLRLRFATPVETSALTRFGTVVKNEEGEAVIEVIRGRIAAITSAALQALPVVDMAVEEVDIEDVVRALFTPAAKAEDGGSPAQSA